MIQLIMMVVVFQQKKLKMKNNMRVILFTNKETGEVECFSSLKPFYDKYPQFEAYSDNIDTYLSRKKTAFENDEIRMQRLEVQRSL